MKNALLVLSAVQVQHLLGVSYNTARKELRDCSAAYQVESGRPNITHYSKYWGTTTDQILQSLKALKLL